MRRAILIVVCAVEMVVLAACQQQTADQRSATVKSIGSSPAEVAERRRIEAEKEVATATDECRSTLDRRLLDYKSKLAGKEYWPAASQLRRCGQLLGDPNIKKLVAFAEIKSYSTDIESKNNSPAERLSAYEKLLRDYPEEAKRYASRHEKMKAEATAKSQQDRYESRFSRTPKIGATQREVLANDWGYPSGINKTTTASGVREQWVYGDGHYLYFENGRLTGIQE